MMNYYIKKIMKNALSQIVKESEKKFLDLRFVPDRHQRLIGSLLT